MRRFNPLIEVEKDDQLIAEARLWSLEKYRLFGCFCDIFTRGIHNIWNQLVYIDLFAGAGYAKIRETGKIYKSSSLIALSLPVPFTKYILCEKDEERFAALSKRISRDHPDKNISLFNVDSNSAIRKVIDAIPSFGKGNTQLPFCFVDPYSLDLDFTIIKALGEYRKMDFLILQALYMDANRNLKNYFNIDNEKVDRYLGNSNWRNEYIEDSKDCHASFVRFLAEQYQKQMVSIGYNDDMNMHQIRFGEKNVPLYYLSFYSKNKRGLQFFKEVQKRACVQLKLDL
jgi:three-Cys-motif partner protein